MSYIYTHTYKPHNIVIHIQRIHILHTYTKAYTFNVHTHIRTHVYFTQYTHIQSIYTTYPHVYACTHIHYTLILHTYRAYILPTWTYLSKLTNRFVKKMIILEITKSTILRYNVLMSVALKPHRRKNWKIMHTPTQNNIILKVLSHVPQCGLT